MKKGMKKTLLLLFVIATMMVLQACGGGSKGLDGTTWTLKSAKMADQEVELEQLGLSMEFKFGKDTVTASMLGEDSEEMKYTLEGDVVKIMSEDGSETLDFKYDGKQMTIDDASTGMTMVLEKTN